MRALSACCELLCFCLWVLKTGKDSDKFSIPKRRKQIKTNGGKARKAKQMECFFFFFLNSQLLNHRCFPFTILEM